MPGARWFPGTQLQLRRPGRPQRPDRSARDPLRHRGWRDHEMSWAELLGRTAAFADGCGPLGVTTGDRVVGYLPNIPEAVIAFLADGEHRGRLERLRPGLFGQGSAGPVRAARTDGAGRPPTATDSAASTDDKRPTTSPRCGTGLPTLRGRGMASPNSPRRPRALRRRRRRSTSTTRCGSCSRPAPPGCPRASCTGTAVCCRTPQSRCAAIRHRAGRHLLLVHQPELDDVELPGRRARWSARPSSVYDGSPAAPRARRAVGHRGSRRRHGARAPVPAMCSAARRPA